MGNLGEMIVHVQTSAPIDSDSPQDVDHAAVVTGNGALRLRLLVTCAYAFVDTY